MIGKEKSVDLLTIADLQNFPVWQYTQGESADDTCVRPEIRVPVASLSGRVVGTQVMLANDERVWALIGNVDSNSPRTTEHFLTLSLERNGRWFTLARYHDFNFAEQGPEALAQFLGLSVDEVFPITYDIRRVTTGAEPALHGQILKEPKERLSRSEIIAMAVS